MTLHIGLDLGGTNIKIATISKTNESLDVLDARTVTTEATAGPEAVTAKLILSGSSEIGDKVFDTAGLGVPGHFDRKTGKVVLFPNLPGAWKGFPLRERLEAGLGIPTWMVNDARAFTLAEGMIGAGKGCHTVACITLGTGIGGGIMIDGRLHRGAFGVAGEIGHQIIDPNGPGCGCGNYGCLEVFTRADVLASLGGKETAAEVFAAARSGDERCSAAVNQVADYLGIGLANVITLIGPDRIVVGGGIAEAGDQLMDPLVAAVRQRVTLVPTGRIDIVPATFGAYAGAVGAAIAGIFRS